MATVESEELQMRLASAEDKRVVMKIRENVYNGFDNMEDYFEHYIKDPNRRCIICEFDGRAAGFLVMSLLNDGESYLVQGGRVSEHVEGKGVFKALIGHCRELGRHAGCVREIVVANSCSMDKKVQTTSYLQSKTPVCTKQMVVVKLDTVTKDKLECVKEDRLDVSPVTDNDLRHYFSNTALRKYLFTGDRLLCNWIPYRLIEGNIMLLRQWNTVYCSSIRAGNDRVSGLLSAYTPLYISNGIQHNIIDIFGSDVRSFERHMTIHIVRALARMDVESKKPRFMLFAADKGPIMEEVAIVLQKYDIQSHKWHLDQEDCLFYSTVFETDL